MPYIDPSQTKADLIQVAQANSPARVKIPPIRDTLASATKESQKAKGLFTTLCAWLFSIFCFCFSKKDDDKSTDPKDCAQEKHKSRDTKRKTQEEIAEQLANQAGHKEVANQVQSYYETLTEAMNGVVDALKKNELWRVATLAVSLQQAIENDEESELDVISQIQNLKSTLQQIITPAIAKDYIGALKEMLQKLQRIFAKRIQDSMLHSFIDCCYSQITNPDVQSLSPKQARDMFEGLSKEHRRLLTQSMERYFQDKGQALKPAANKEKTFLRHLEKWTPDLNQIIIKIVATRQIQLQEAIPQQILEYISDQGDEF